MLKGTPLLGKGVGGYSSALIQDGISSYIYEVITFLKAVEVLDHPSYRSSEVARAAGCSLTDEADSISRR